MARARCATALTSVLLLVSALASAEPTVLGFALPGRTDAALRPRMRQVAEGVAHAVGGVVVSDDDAHKLSDLPAVLERARSLSRRALFDQAASIYDDALDRAMRSPQQVDEPERFVSALITRSSIALARGESRRAAQLVERLLRYDPMVALLPAEDEPGIHGLLQATRRRLGPQPAVGPEELGQACRAAGIVIVGRSLDADRVELLRFDDCRLVAKAEVASAAVDETAAAALVGASSSASATPALQEQRARNHLESGLGFYRMGQYPEAITELAAGYALSPQPIFLLNIAQAYQRTGDLEHARQSYRRYLAAAPPGRERDDAERELAQIDHGGATPPPARSEPRRTRPSSRSARAMAIAGWTTLGVGVGALVLGGAWTGLAAHTSDEIERPTAGKVWSASLDDRLHLYQDLDIAFFAVGGVAVVTGAVLAILAHRSARHAASSDGPTTAASVVLRPTAVRLAF